MILKSNLSAWWRAGQEALAVIALRWSTVRSFRIKSIFAIVAYILTLVLGFMVNVGALFAELATRTSLEEGAIARAWLEDVASGELGLLSIAFIGTGLGIVLLSPFTGASSLTLIDEDSAMPFGFVRGRRFFDSVAFSAVSAVSIIHLLVAVMTASLLSISGNRFWSIGVSVLWWLMFLFAASAFGWFIDIVYTRIGRAAKWLYGFVLAAVAAFIYYSPGVQVWLLDIVNNYGKFIVNLSIGSASTIAWGLAMSLAGVITISFVGYNLVRIWDSAPAQQKALSGKSKAHGMKSLRRGSSLTRFTVATLWRTREIRRTLVAVTLAGAVSSTYFFTTAPDSILAGIAIGVPAVSALVWAANAYGPFGSGLTWLLGQPKVKNNLGRILFLLSILQTLTIATIFILPLVVVHIASLSSLNYTYYATTFIINTLVISSIAALLATFRPYTVRLAGKGEAILPPSAAIGYLALFGGLGAAFSGLTSYLVGPVLDPVAYGFIQLGSQQIGNATAYGVAVLLLVFVAIYVSKTAWNSSNSQRKLIAIATGD